MIMSYSSNKEIKERLSAVKEEIESSNGCKRTKVQMETNKNKTRKGKV